MYIRLLVIVSVLTIIPGCALRPYCSSEQVLTFGAIAAAQYADKEPHKTRHYRNSIDKLNTAIEEFNTHDLDFVVHLGDVIDTGWDAYDDVLPVMSKSKAPVRYVLGNHEFAVAAEKKNQVADRLGLEDPYYDFKIKKWRFVVLNGNDVSYIAATTPEQTAAADRMFKPLAKRGATNAMNWNGGLGAEQLEWLESILANADRKKEKVILFCHFPVFPDNAHNLWNCDDVLSLIDKHKSVKAYFNGHDHRGHYAERDGVHYITMRGMVEKEVDTGFAIIRVFGDHLEVIGFGEESSRMLLIR